MAGRRAGLQHLQHANVFALDTSGAFGHGREVCAPCPGVIRWQQQLRRSPFVLGSERPEARGANENTTERCNTNMVGARVARHACPTLQKAPRWGLGLQGKIAPTPLNPLPPPAQHGRPAVPGCDARQPPLCSCCGSIGGQQGNQPLIPAVQLPSITGPVRLHGKLLGDSVLRSQVTRVGTC